ncbi:MAG: hypothetical protein J6S14_15075 [Clostridia bacterium]|nr:hypothetical protein [Clostridia bacterium]
MKNFIGGMVFGALIYPALTYCASIVETAVNLAVTKMSVIMAKDAAELEKEDGVVTHAIGFVAPDDLDDEEEDEE